MNAKPWAAFGCLVVSISACKNPTLTSGAAQVALAPGVSRIRLLAPAEWTTDTLVPPNPASPRCALPAGTELKVRNATVLGSFLRVEALDAVPGCALRSGYLPTQGLALVEGAAPTTGPAPAGSPAATPRPTVSRAAAPSPTPAGPTPSKAFLDVIAYAEGTKGRGDDGYNVIFTHAQFTGYADHPRQVKCSGSLCSDASGRYQFLSTTWDGVKRNLGLSDFGKVNQDKGGLYLARNRGVTNTTQRLDKAAFSTAVLKLGKEWASMPGSPYGQPTHTVDELWGEYQKYLR